MVGACVVDEDYQGEVHINMINTNQPSEYYDMDGHYATNPGHVTITPGDKLVQFILLPINYSNPEETTLEELYTNTTERGEGGSGSTGIV